MKLQILYVVEYTAGRQLYYDEAGDKFKSTPLHRIFSLELLRNALCPLPLIRREVRFRLPEG